MLKESTRNFYIGVVRTTTPIIVSFILTLFLSAGIDLDTETEASLSLMVFGVLNFLYYVIVSALERWVAPKLGWLLGVHKLPEYEKTNKEEKERLDETNIRVG